MSFPGSLVPPLAFPPKREEAAHAASSAIAADFSVHVACRAHCAGTAQKKSRPKERLEVCSQGGVKQSGQEPLDVQKLDNSNSDLETLMSG